MRKSLLRTKCPWLQAVVALVVWCGHGPLEAAGVRGPGGLGHLAQGTPLLQVAAIDAASLVARDLEKSTGSEKRLRFAEPFEAQANQRDFGQWEMLDDGLARWSLFIHAPGATDVNVGFSELVLPSGGTLRLSSADGAHTAGPYTRNDVTDAGEFWTPMLPGDFIVIVVDVPLSLADQFRVTVGSVNSGYRDLLRSRSSAEKQDASKQDGCNIDVVCPVTAGWENPIRSVGRYTISGMYLCTGSLVMNQRADFRAYFLTANHCVSTTAEAGSVVVYWNYQSPTCGALSGGSLGQSQSGASLRATHSASDFALLELNSVPDAAFNVHYAGWDRSGGGISGAAGIHHPSGDEKAWSYENHALESTAYLGSTVDASATHWRIVDWDSGTTEGGSSGSGLWQGATQRIVGQLHGGYAACGNDQSDWYGKLSTSWTGGGTSATRLRDWLDPDNTGLTALDGQNPTSSGPPNDNFASAISISGSSGQTTGSNVGATLETGEPSYHGGQSVWWRWTAPSSSTVTIDTFSSTFDTKLAAYTGSSVGSLTVLADNDDSGGYQSQIEFNVVGGTTYWIAVGGLSASEGNITLNWNQNIQPSTLTISPANRSHTSAAASGQTIGVTANVAWTATESLNWVTITGGASGSGNGTVTYSVTANTGPSRSGTITVAGGGITRPFTVDQEGVAPTTYTVSYIANGATSGTAPAPQTKTHDVSLKLAVNSGNLAKSGCIFAGWNTAANGFGTGYAAGGIYTANASVTLYAKWITGSYISTSQRIYFTYDSSSYWAMIYDYSSRYQENSSPGFIAYNSDQTFTLGVWDVQVAYIYDVAEGRYTEALAIRDIVL